MNFLNSQFVRDIVFVFKYFKARVITAVILIIVLCAGSAVAVSELVVTDVYCDNQLQKVITLSSDADEIIAKSGFTVKDDQKVILEYFNPDEKESIIIIANAHDALVYDGEKLISVVTVTGTVGDAIEAAGLTLKDGDEINYPESMGLTANIQIKIARSFPVLIKADGKSCRINVTGGTVGQALTKAGIELGEDDIVSGGIDKQLSGETELTVQRVRYEEYKETVVLEHELKIEYDDSMYEDKSVVKVKGSDGKEIRYYAKKYVDGEYVGTELLSSEVKKEPVTRVVVRGTKVRPGGFSGASVQSGKVMSVLTPPFSIPLNQNGRPINYLKVITGKATAYCTGTITSTGVRPAPGYVAVDPREIPYGTKMYIVSSDGRYNYGYCIAADTGGFIYNSSTVVDLYMYSYSDCVRFGRRNVDIYILEWGSGFGTKR